MTSTARGPYILTHSGIRFHPLAPKPADFLIEDIAYALSNICRYGGHVPFYSVGEHSVLVSEAAEAYASHDDAGPWARPAVVRLALCALLHDAAEAYPPGDILGPMKKTHAFAGVASLQSEIETMLAERFTPWLSGSLNEVVHDADQWLFGCEATSLRRPCGAAEKADVAALKRRLSVLRFFSEPVIRRLEPSKARALFMRRYGALTKELGR